MSAVYGYTVRKQLNENFINILKAQNVKYGQDFEGYELLANPDKNKLSGQQSSSALGCCLKVLSDRQKSETTVITYGKYKAVFDALIYNRDEMESQLNSDSFDLEYKNKFSAMNDGELLFFYILRYSPCALKEVNGDFSGAIYNTENREWTLVRDHSGIRPLFYYLDQETFIFSTDIRGIIGFPGVDLPVNETNLYNLMMGYNDLTLCETDYAQIHCIRPAAWTIIDAGLNKSEHIYWAPGGEKIHYKQSGEYAKKLRELVIDSIQRRLNAVSGVVGCELSGGLDSSVIAILIHRLGRHGIYFSWSDSPDDHPLRNGEDERKVIADICAQEGITCSFAVKRPVGDHKTIAQILEQQDVPYINTQYLAEGSGKVNRQGANVMFTGHGGDEGVSHRGNFYELWYQGEYFAFFRAIWNSTSIKDKRLLRFGYRVLRQFFYIHPNFKAAFRNGRNMEYFLTDGFKEKMKNAEHLPLPFAYDPAAYILQGGHRVRIDNAAVQGGENGIQYIFPYLDYRVLDFALGIPRYCFQNGFTNRAVFREAFADLMPDSLRRVHYKDEASYRGFKPTSEEVQAAAEVAVQAENDLLAYLDETIWGNYLDFEKLRQQSVEPVCTEADVNRAARFIEGLMRCAMVQNLQERLAQNCTPPEET